MGTVAHQKKLEDNLGKYLLGFNNVKRGNVFSMCYGYSSSSKETRRNL